MSAERTEAAQPVPTMSIDHRPTRDHAQAGFSLLELVIATVMLIALSFLVTSLIVTGNEAHKYADRLGRVTEITQEILDDMQAELRSTVRLFGDDAVGNAYTAALADWPEASPIDTTRLPVLDTNGAFAKDVIGTEKTGNAMLFARHAWADSFTCTSTTTYRIDVYRIVGYYLKAENGGPNPQVPWGLNLVKWVSEPMASAEQIDAITDPTDQAEVLEHLRTASPDIDGNTHSPLNLVWLLGADPTAAGTFRQIVSPGTMVSTAQSPRTPSTWEIMRAENLCSPGRLYYRYHSVASNYARANQGVGTFGLRDDANHGFPHGFEVQVIGPASARQVLIHLVNVSTNNKGMKAFYRSQVVAAVREG